MHGLSVTGNISRRTGIIIGMRKKIVLTGGGTAGHAVPLLALLPYFGNRYEVHFIGRKSGVERELAEKADVIYHGIDCPKLTRGSLAANIAVPFALIRSRRKTRAILRDIAPSLILAKGGYVSLPAALESGGVPLVLHESDTSLGLANRLAAKRAAVICSSFPLPDYKGRKIKCVGSPIRKEIYLGDRERARMRCGFKGRKKVLLVMGGSLGAKAINEAVDANIETLTQRYDVIHLRGKGDPAAPFEGYFPMEFTPEPHDFFALADLAVTRGGGNTLFELGALGVPMLIIPLPKGASRGDQIANAEYFASHGLALTMDQADSAALPERVALLDAKSSSLTAALRAYRFDGTEELARLCIKIAETGAI